MFVEKTKKDGTVCPCCGSCDTDFFDSWSNKDNTESESRHCYKCGEDYKITFDADENVVNICDKHNFSLVNQPDIATGDTVVKCIDIIGESMPTLEEAERFCAESMKIGGKLVCEVEELSSDETHRDFNLENEDSLPIFKKDAIMALSKREVEI